MMAAESNIDLQGESIQASEQVTKEHYVMAVLCHGRHDTRRRRAELLMSSQQVDDHIC